MKQNGNGCKKVKHSLDSNSYARSQYCFPTSGDKLAQRQWLARHPLFVSNGRAFVKVCVNSKDRNGSNDLMNWPQKLIILYMDCITGHFHRELVSHVENNALARKILYNNVNRHEYNG